MGMFKIAQAPMPIGDIVVNGRTYRPQPDITSYEIAVMLRMWAMFAFPGHNNDYERYIVANGLERHWPKETT